METGISPGDRETYTSIDLKKNKLRLGTNLCVPSLGRESAHILKCNIVEAGGFSVTGAVHVLQGLVWTLCDLSMFLTHISKISSVAWIACLKFSLIPGMDLSPSQYWSHQPECKLNRMQNAKFWQCKMKILDRDAVHRLIQFCQMQLR